MLVATKAHHNDFADTLKEVYKGENCVAEFNLWVPLALEIWVVVARVVTRSKEGRVNQDADGYEVIKPGTNDDMSRQLSEPVLFQETENATFRKIMFLAGNDERSIFVLISVYKHLSQFFDISLSLSWRVRLLRLRVSLGAHIASVLDSDDFLSWSDLSSLLSTHLSPFIFATYVL